jgi:hypothetical protein
VPEFITGNDARYAHEVIETICAEVGPGLPGSAQECERAAILKGKLESHLGTGNVAVEEFTVAPDALVSAYPISALFMLLAVLLTISIPRLGGASAWVAAVAALAFSVLSPLAFLFQFVLNREIADAILPKKRSANVVGCLRRPGDGNVKRVLILSGHHDSAPSNVWFGLLHEVKRLLAGSGATDRAREATWYRRMGYVFYGLSTIWSLGFVATLALSIVQLAEVVAGDAAVGRFGTPGWVLLAFPIAPSLAFSAFFTRRGKNGGIVPGAADNLSASAVTVAMSRFLAQNPSHIPPDTEIRFISFGSEEAGVRGSRRYVARHVDELKRMGARVLNFETIAQSELIILTGEQSGAVRVSPEMVQSVVTAAKRCGIPHRVEAPWLGAGGDAAPFAQADFHALTVIGMNMPEDMIAFYHQKWDRPEVVSIDGLQNALKLALEWIRCSGE